MYYKIITTASWRTFAKLENRNSKTYGFDYDVILGCISLCTEKQLHKQISTRIFRHTDKWHDPNELVVLALRIYPSDDIFWIKKESDEEEYPYMFSPMTYKHVCWTENVTNRPDIL